MSARGWGDTLVDGLDVQAIQAGYRHARAALAARGALHFAAHSHHPWPDATLPGQIAAWEDAVTLLDDKWDRVFGSVLPTAEAHIRRLTRAPDTLAVSFAPNTHELVYRLLTALPTPATILTTDGEFHSFDRQIRRLEEVHAVRVTRVAMEPYDTFWPRFTAAAHALAAAHQPVDLAFVSQVCFATGRRLPDAPAQLGQVPARWRLLDGYHSFCAIPVDLSGATGAHEIGFVAGGYKYAQAGEGACFLLWPRSWAPRPRYTGWFAAFDALASEHGEGAGVPFSESGLRLAGSTFDPSGLYRFNAAMRWLQGVCPTVEALDTYVQARIAQFLGGMRACGGWGPLREEHLVVGANAEERGHFLTFHAPNPAATQRGLAERGVLVDHRGPVVRIGFGLYHTPEDIDAFWARLAG